MTVFSHRAPRTKLPTKWKVGDVIAQLYEVLDSLGDAGMGSIYKVYHRGWNEVLVVRQPRAQMFTSEGLRYGSRLAARLAGHSTLTQQQGKADEEAVLKFTELVKGWVNLGLHPHIVPCYDVQLLDGLPHLFIDYMAGGTLTDWISSGRLYEGGDQVALARMLDFAIQVAWGLQYAHDQGMVHRNLKPSNIMITPDEVVKISDFTLAEARVAAGEVSDGLGNMPGQSIIVPGVGLMTREYASPEQAVGQPLTHQSDLWSWGVILLEMFMGEVTWWLGTVVGAALESYLQSGASNPAIPAMPVALTALLKRCFEPNPIDRPAQMLDVAQELQKIYKQAIWHEYPRTIPQLKPYLVDNRNNQALTLLERGKLSQADDIWLEILNKVGRHLPSATNLGFSRWQRGQMTSEVLKNLLEEGIRGNKHIPWQTNYLLGLINLKLNEPRDALLSLEKAREQASEVAQVEAAYRLASYLLPVQQMGGVLDDELASYHGHLLAVSAVTFSPDGHFALSGSDDGTLRLWQLETGRCIRLYEGHTEAISAIAMIEAPEGGRTLALSGSEDGTLRLWDATVQRQAVNEKLLPGQATGQCLRVFSIEGDEEGHGDAITSVVFIKSPPLLATDEGQRLLVLSGSKDKSLRLWDIETGNVEKVLKGHTGTVGALAVSPDGRFVLSGADDKTVQLWELSTGRSIRRLEAHTAEVTTVAMLPPGIKMGAGQAWAGEMEHEFALSGSNDGTLRLWNLTTGECLQVLGDNQTDNQEGHTEEVTSVSLSHDGRLALSGSWDETLRLWDMATGRCLHTFEGHLAEIRSVSISPDGHFILSGADDGTLRLWGIPPEHLQISAWCLARPIWYQGLPNSAKEVQRLLEEINKQIEAENFAMALALLQKAREIRAYQRSPQVLSVYERLSLFTRRTALRDGWLARVFKGHTNQVTSVSLSADARFALSGSEDSTLRLWEMATGRCLRIFKRHTAGVLSVSLSTNGRLAISGSWDETVRLWDVETGRCLRTFTGHAGAVTSVHLSPDMRWGLSAGVDSTVRVWDLNSGRSLHVFEEPSLVGSACFSANGRFVLTGNMDYGVRLWDLTTGELLRTLKGHTKEVTAVSMSANNRFVLSGSLDHTLRLWDITTGHCLGTFESDGQEIYAVALSANGRWALSGSLDKTVRIWDMRASLTNNTQHACIHTFKRGFPGVQGGGHFGNIRSVTFSADGHWVLSGSRDGTLRLWRLDWELQANQASNWDSNALWAQRVRPYLDNFLTLHTPYLASTSPLPEEEGSDDDMMQRFMRQGKPTWDEEEFQAFIHHLQQMGYGWIRADSLRLALDPEGFNTAPALTQGANATGVALNPSATSEGRVEEGLQWDASQSREPEPQTVTSQAKKVGAAKVEPKEGQNGQLIKGKMRARTRQTQNGNQAAHRLLPTTQLSSVYKRVGIKEISLLKPFEGHIEGVKSVCLTADGRFAVSASWDKTLRLWDIETGRTVRTYEGHDDGIYAVCLIPQPPSLPIADSPPRPIAEKMLSGSRDGSLRLWDIETGELLRLFEGHTGEVRCLSVSPDGRWALSGSDDKSIRLWDIASGRCLRIFEGHSDSVRALTFSADGQRFLSGSRDKTMRLWELATHRCLRTFEGHTGWVTGVAMSPDKRLVYSASDDKSIRIWEANTGQYLRSLEGHTNWLTDITLSSDGRFLLSAAWDNTIRLWDVKRGEQLRVFPTVEAGGHRGVINSVIFSNNAQVVLSGSYDGTLRLWKLEWELDNHKPSNWDPIARCYLENFLILQTPYLMPLPTEQKEWSNEAIDMALTRRGEPTWEEDAYEGLLNQLRDAGLGFIAPETVRIQLERLVSTPKLLSGNTQRFRALPGGKQDTGIRTGLRKATLVKTLHGHTASISSISLSGQDSSLALSGSWDNRLLLWDISTTESGHIGSFEGHADKIHSVMLTQSASGELLALSGSRDHTMRLWQMPNGQQPPKGQQLRIFEGHTSDIQAISISPDGRFALSGSDDSTLRLWEVATGQQLRILNGHSTPITTVCFSHDGRFALSGSGSLFLHDDLDNSLRLWDIATGECLRTFGSQAHKKDEEDEKNEENQEDKAHDAGITAISISTDNRLALSGSHDNTLRLWKISTGECLHVLEGHSEAVTSACISHDSKFALSGSRDGTMRLWDLSTGASLHTFAGHIGVINAVNISQDGNYALSGGYDTDLRLWELEWDYEPALAASWDESALPYLETFLTLRTPYRENALTRAGDVSWTDEDFQQLLIELRHAGYGWLDPKGVRSELEHLSESWFEPPPLPVAS